MTKTAWRYEIKYGPEGEANYAWVYDADGEMVCTAKTHHAKAIVTRMNALASLQGEDAVERVAHAVTSEFGRMYKDGVPICMREGETTWRTYYAGFDLSQFAQRITDAALAACRKETSND